MIYCNPSFETEKYTHAFDRILWWAVCLISMFTVGIGVTAVGLCGASVLNITSTVLQDYITIVLILFFTVTLIIYFVGLLEFASVLTTSYKFDGDTIVKGKVAIKGGMITKITANTDFEFVKTYFDTEKYKKTVYENAVLIGETKRYLKYLSNNKVIKILKIYDSMPDLRIAENTVKKSVAGRIAVRAVSVFIIFLAFEITDLCIGYNKNDTVNNGISENNAAIEEILTENGFSMQKMSNNVYIYTKPTSDNSRTSELRIIYTSDGSAEKYDIEMFIENENEISALEKLLNIINNSNNNDVFIENVRKQFYGETSYSKLKLENGQTLRLKTSGGYTEVHTSF